jgi:branched-chain amino acid transport system substrate-binding protein
MVKIVFLAPLTGPESVVGVPMRQVVGLAIEEANQTGRLPFAVELLALDDEADPVRARALAEALVQDTTVVGVVGHKNSGPSGAAGEIYAAAGLAQVTPSSTNSDLARRGWPTFFRVCADNDRQAAAAAHYALEVLHVRRVAAVHDQTDYGWPLAEAFVSAVQAGGADVVLVEPVRLGQREFGDTVRCLQDADCDLVYFGLTEIESSFLARELRAAGVQAHLFGADGSRQSPFPQLAGEAAEGVYETYAGQDAQASAQTQAFLLKFESRFGACPIFGLEVYDAAGILLEAIRRASGVESASAGPGRAPSRMDRSAVLREVRALRGFTGVTGPVSFDPNGNRRDAQVTIWRVIDGKMAPI